MQKAEEARAVQSAAPSAKQGVPGMWAAIMIAGLAGLGVGYWAQAGKAGQVAAGASRLAEVAPQDLPDALGTVEATPDQLKQFKDRQACNSRLAWVTIGRGSGQQAGRIRLQSGSYISPTFSLAEMPVRVALPYPAPYEAGRGTISVVGADSDAIVALTPPWHVQAQGGVRSQEVTWIPAGTCPAGKP